MLSVPLADQLFRYKATSHIVRSLEDGPRKLAEIGRITREPKAAVHKTLCALQSAGVVERQDELYKLTRETNGSSVDLNPYDQRLRQIFRYTPLQPILAVLSKFQSSLSVVEIATFAGLDERKVRETVHLLKKNGLTELTHKGRRTCVVLLKQLSSTQDLVDQVPFEPIRPMIKNIRDSIVVGMQPRLLAPFGVNSLRLGLCVIPREDDKASFRRRAMELAQIIAQVKGLQINPVIVSMLAWQQHMARLRSTEADGNTLLQNIICTGMPIHGNFPPLNLYLLCQLIAFNPALAPLTEEEIRAQVSKGNIRRDSEGYAFTELWLTRQRQKTKTADTQHFVDEESVQVGTTKIQLIVM